ncbi:MAG: adenosine deaminase, partial [Acidimicrobiia bacterium]
DPDLVKRLADDQIPLTVCPQSNAKLRVVGSLADHPIRRMLDAGLNVSIHSDDPAYFGGYVGDNYLNTAQALDLSESELTRIAANSIQSVLG